MTAGQILRTAVGGWIVCQLSAVGAAAPVVVSQATSAPEPGRVVWPASPAALPAPAAPTAVRFTTPADFSRNRSPAAPRVIRPAGLSQPLDTPSSASDAPPARSPVVPPAERALPPVPVPPGVGGEVVPPPGPAGTTLVPPGSQMHLAPAMLPAAGEPGADGKQMSLADFEGLALGSNPTLVRAGATIRASQGNYVQVGLYPNPFVGYNGSQVGDRNTAGQQGVYFGQMLVLGGKLRLNRAVASQDIRANEQDFSAVRLRVLTDVRLRYVEVVVAQRSLALTRTLVDLGSRGVNAAEALLRAQEVSRVDVLQARIELDQARLQLVRAQNRYQASWRGLAAVVGMPGLASSPVEDILTQAPPEREWDTTWAQIMSMSPELGAAQARVNRASFTLQRARVQPVPNLDNQFMVQYDNAARERIGFIQSTMTIPLWDRNQGAIRQAQAQLGAARADLRRLQMSLQARLALAFERYANARQQVERYSRDILPNAQTTFELVAAGYRQGEFPFLNYLTAQRTYFQVNLFYVEALRELWSSAAVIDGLLLYDSLETGLP